MLHRKSGLPDGEYRKTALWFSGAERRHAKPGPTTKRRMKQDLPIPFAAASPHTETDPALEHAKHVLVKGIQFDGHNDLPWRSGPAFLDSFRGQDRWDSAGQAAAASGRFLTLARQPVPTLGQALPPGKRQGGCVNLRSHPLKASRRIAGHRDVPGKSRLIAAFLAATCWADSDGMKIHRVEKSVVKQ